MDNIKIESKKHKLQIGIIISDWEILSLPETKNPFIKCKCTRCKQAREIRWAVFLYKSPGRCSCQKERKNIQKVVRYLNKNQIEYSWQPEVFKLSTGRTYRPDLYLIDQDLWIEIKGFFLGMAEEKWNEFHSIIKPNSELWNLQKLKEMKIL